MHFRRRHRKSWHGSWSWWIKWGNGISFDPPQRKIQFGLTSIMNVLSFPLRCRSCSSIKAPLRPAQQLLVKRRDKQLFPFLRCFLLLEHFPIKTTLDKTKLEYVWIFYQSLTGDSLEIIDKNPLKWYYEDVLGFGSLNHFESIFDQLKNGYQKNH